MRSRIHQVFETHPALHLRKVRGLQVPIVTEFPKPLPLVPFVCDAAHDEYALVDFHEFV